MYNKIEIISSNNLTYNKLNICLNIRVLYIL